MASFNVTSLTTTSQTLNTGETGLVTVNGTLSTAATSITVAHTTTTDISTIGIFGTVFSTDGSAIGTTGTADTIMATVGEQGSVVSGSAGITTAAIRLTLGDFFSLNNAGLVSGGSAVQLNGTTGTQNATIVNTGTMIGSGAAVLSTITTNSAFENLTVTNNGLITHGGSFRAINYDGSSGLLILTNTGTISATGGAIRSASGLALDNSGTIKGNMDFVLRADIFNSGLIDGSITDTSIVGLQIAIIENAGRITGNMLLGDGDDQIRNFGNVDGDVLLRDGLNQLANLGGSIGGAVTAGGDDDILRNSGTIFGNVTLGDGNDTFNGRGGTTLGTVQGGNGNDTFIIDTGDVTIEGGTGFDTVFSTASYKMGLDVEVLNLQGLQGLTGIGRGANEFITGSDGNDTLLGRGGDDNLNGGEGDNLLQGGQGNDVLAMTNGSSTLDGGGGVDFVILLPGLDAVRSVVNLASGTATSFGAADDVVATATLQGIENVGGSTGNDNIAGSKGANILTGSLGFDTLSGGDGNDSQDGGNDADSLSGGKGDDTLYGNFGADTLNGGTGADVFQFLSTAESPVGASDLIADFTTASDRIDISAIDADVVAGGDQAFVFVGTAAFAGPGAQVRMVQDAGAGTTTVQLRLAGSVATSMEFVLTGVVNLTAAHFDL